MAGKPLAERVDIGQPILRDLKVLGQIGRHGAVTGDGVQCAKNVPGDIGVVARRDVGRLERGDVSRQPDDDGVIGGLCMDRGSQRNTGGSGP